MASERPAHCTRVWIPADGRTKRGHAAKDGQNFVKICKQEEVEAIAADRVCLAKPDANLRSEEISVKKVIA